MFSLINTYALAAATTLMVWALVAFYTNWNWEAVFAVVILTVLEITFSFENAIINSRILVGLSRLWQRLFMTAGILIAVFAVRFALPIVIVSISAQLSFARVIDMALAQPEQYAAALHVAGPVIEAFGGTFLLMIGISYFINEEKRVHWLGPIERSLARAGQLDNLVILLMLVVTFVIFLTIGAHEQVPVLIASGLGMGLHSLLRFCDGLFVKRYARRGGQKQTHRTGWAAFVAFMYLEVLDASFSLDGVIGAFAITPHVVLIMAGLGAGAVWVRSMTIHLLRANTLSKYQYLEHGAHWAIIALGIVLLIKLYGIEPPDWFSGLVGLAVIATSVYSSIRYRKQRLTS